MSDTLRVESPASLFQRFGGIRPMARHLGTNHGTVGSWSKARQIPVKWHALILRRASELGLDVAAEDVTFPFPEDRVVS